MAGVRGTHPNFSIRLLALLPLSLVHPFSLLLLLLLLLAAPMRCRHRTPSRPRMRPAP